MRGRWSTSRGVAAASASASSPGTVGRGVVHDQHGVVRRAAASAARTRLHDRLEVLALVVGRDDTQTGPAGIPRHRLSIAFTLVAMPAIRNAEIAAALDELADLYELDGAVIYRVVAYREAAKSVRDSPGSVAQLAAARTCDRAAQRRQDARGEDPGAGRDRRHPTGGQSFGRSSPASWSASSRSPAWEPRRHGRSTTSSASARSTSCGMRRRRSALKSAGLGPKAEQNIARRLKQDGGPAQRVCCCPPCSTIGERIVEALREHPTADRVEIAGSARRMTDTCKDLDIIATARRPRGAHPRVHARWSWWARSRERRGGRPRRHPQRAAGRLPRGRAGPVRQRAPAPDGLQAAQHGAARVRGPARPPRQRVRRRGRRDGRRTVRDRAGGVRAARPAVHRAGAARGPRRAARPRRAAGSRSRHGRPTCGDLHCHTTLSDGRRTLAQMARPRRSVATSTSP